MNLSGCSCVFLSRCQLNFKSVLPLLHNSISLAVVHDLRPVPVVPFRFRKLHIHRHFSSHFGEGNFRIMDRRLVECVPNFSEGVNKETLDAIADAVRRTNGVSLLGVDPGASTNRTVFTFVGTPDAVIEGALAAAKTAYKLIDMTKHKGEHPRLGAMDVCPFVPVRDVTMDDCAECARIMGERLAKELDIPVYLYGAAAKHDYRRSVPQIRAGEYEALASRITQEEWKPDFGPAKFIGQWGASMVGARKFLLAYNINMLSTKEQAHRIALDLREAGRGPGQEGKFKAVQGIGWWLDEANMAQISVNITDIDVTALHQVYEEAKRIAKSMNLSVAGSELVGLTPLSALTTAADYYIKTENLFVLDEDQKVRLAIDRLGLSSLYPFDPKERIIEWKVRESDPPRPLLDATVVKFVHQVRARTSAPGGGSVAALVGALGASLGSMVGLLTFGKRQWDHLDDQMRGVIPPLYLAVDKLLPFVEADTQAFEEYVEACRVTKDANSAQAQAALLNAINVPLELAKTLDQLWDPMEKMSKLGNPNCLSDIQVGVKCIETGVWGARCNVLINCDSLTDKELKTSLVKQVNTLYKKAQERCSIILEKLETK